MKTLSAVLVMKPWESSAQQSIASDPVPGSSGENGAHVAKTAEVAIEPERETSSLEHWQASHVMGLRKMQSVAMISLVKVPPPEIIPFKL